MTRTYTFVLVLSLLFFCRTELSAQETIIPVVFHILHEGGVENISDAQVLDAIRILNRDYNRTDTSGINPPFNTIVANMQIEFRLANKDPKGNCTNGIDRIYTSLTNRGDVHDKINAWPRDKYLNIWVTRSIVYGTAAYTYYPWQTDSFPDYDGIVIINNYVGSIGTASPLNSRTLTHEVGQVMGLLDMWPSNNGGGCGDDSVADTPPVGNFNTFLGCGGDSVYTNCSTLPVNTQNFMLYSYCSRMFTNGQKERLHQYLNRGVAGRNNLWTTENLIATGTMDSVFSICAPVCDFAVNKTFICLGDSVSFTDVSYDSITARVWAFPSSAVASSTTNSFANVKFHNTGWQTVSLTVMNNKGNATKTKQLVYVAETDSQLHVPYYNSFEDANEVAADWTSVNYDQDTVAFQYNNLTAQTGTGCILLNNYYSAYDYSLDEFISPLFDCSTLTSADDTLGFSYAYASGGVDFSLTDSLAVLVTKNCGKTWVPIYKTGGLNLINDGESPTYFIPHLSYQWTALNIHIPDTFRVSNVRFKIQSFSSYDGNNLFIDDFRIGPAIAVGLQDLTSLSFTAMPNPFDKTVELYGLPHGRYEFTIYDVTGRVLLVEKDISTDNHYIRIDMSSLPSNSVYFLKAANGNNTGAIKLLKGGL